MDIRKIIREELKNNFFINEQSSDFNKWFKGSKVVDKNGEPLILYHGGPKFDVFNAPIEGDKGIYFTDNRWLAHEFASQHEEVFRKRNNDDYSDVPEEMWDDNEDMWDEKYFKYTEVKRCYLKMLNPVDTFGDAKLIPLEYDDKHDGVIMRGTKDFGYTSTQFVVFEPEQIWII